MFVEQREEILLAPFPVDLSCLHFVVAAGIANTFTVELYGFLCGPCRLPILDGGVRALIGNNAAAAEDHALRQTVECLGIFALGVEAI